MKKAALILGTFALAVALCWAAPAQAIVPQMTTVELADASQSIVHGRVISLVPHWNEERTTILTRVTVDPIQYMKGEPDGGQVVFEMPGGVVGELGLAVSDVPHFEVGEEVVLFLRSEYFRVVGWWQGKLSVKDGVVLGKDMTLDQFRAHIAELTGVRGLGGETRGSDDTVIRPARLVAPPFADRREGEQDSAARGPGPEPTPNAEVVVMSEDFEGLFPSGSWVLPAGPTGHEWGKETYRVHGGSYSMWECAGGSSALPSGSDYANNMQTWAIYGPFDLSDATSAELRFWRSVQTASEDDYVFWGASANGSNFDGFSACYGTGSWVSRTLDLGSYLGDGTVYIAFVFESDATNTDKGAFIDDVELVKTTLDPDSPVITSISPDSGAAGAGVSVTITGSNFGATKGTSEVLFLYNPLGTPTIAADVITSWSDTEIICEVPERAGSGPVNVVVDGDPGTGADFFVTYGASWTWWRTSEPMGEDMLINPNCADAPEADVLAACIKGFQEWNSESGADFSFTYGGATGATSEGFNQVNVIAWGTTTGSLATNYSWYNEVTGAMLENDIIFDDEAWTWSVSGEPGEYDIQSVMTHELGHCLRLVDLYGDPDVGKTMYGRISDGQTAVRTIEDSERGGAQYFYGSNDLNITTEELPVADTPAFYSENIQAVGGTPPRTFSLRSGPGLPDGLSLSAGGVVSGFLREAGTFYFNVKVTDATLETDSQVIKLVIDSAAPVVLNDLSASPVDEGILVEWSLCQCSDLGEFYIHRSVVESDGEYQVLNETPVVASDGMGRSYSFLDKNVVDGTLYYYKLETREGGEGIFFGPVSAVASVGRAGAFWLGQNEPNPFSPAKDGRAVLTFSLPVAARASVRIYDVAGRLIASPLEDAFLPAGVNEIVWEGVDEGGRTVPSGIYFYDLYTDGFYATRKMMLAR